MHRNDNNNNNNNILIMIGISLVGSRSHFFTYGMNIIIFDKPLYQVSVINPLGSQIFRFLREGQLTDGKIENVKTLEQQIILL